jgi:hypothetical protein
MLSEDELQAIERALADWYRGEHDFEEAGEQIAAAVPAVLAEVRRLWSLFPEADARMCESAARAFSLQDEDGVYSDLTSELDDIAARIRSIRGDTAK